MDKSKPNIVFGDGSSLGNPGPGGWGVVAHLNDEVIERGGADPYTTNNAMETKALVEALALIEEHSQTLTEVWICFDSQYVLRAAQSWVFGWSKKAWKNSSGNPVANQDLWREVLERSLRIKKKTKMRFFYVAGHSGHDGNERVDELARSFAEGSNPILYKGDLSQYSVDLFSQLDGIQPIEEIESRPFAKPKANTKGYYLSFVGGTLYRDETWGACEARVKGVSGAKYKKIKSSNEEEQILKQWGVKF